jgi:hypothetical protein
LTPNVLFLSVEFATRTEYLTDATTGSGITRIGITQSI